MQAGCRATCARLKLLTMGWLARLLNRGRIVSGSPKDSWEDRTLRDLLPVPLPGPFAAMTWQPIGDDFSSEDAMTTDELAEWAWLAWDAPRAEWTLSVADEWKAVIDIGLDEDADPLIAALRSVPCVTDVEHVDREVWVWRARLDIATEAMSEHVLRALAAAHRAASTAGVVH